jgi:hypothetical protein
MSAEMDVAVLIPTTGYVPVEFATALVLGVSDARVKAGIIYNKAPGVDLSRNALVLTALKTPAKYFLFWDTDVIPFKFTEDGRLEPFVGLVQYMYDLAESTGEAIVSGVYFGKNNLPTMYSIDIEKYRATGELDWKPYSIVLGKRYYVDAIGMGLAMIRREVFESLDFPWFKYVYELRNGTVYEVSEDIYFCLKARLKGYRILVDTSIYGKHIMEGAMLHDGRVEVLG